MYSSYTTVVLYIGIKKVWDFLPKSSIYKTAKCLLSDTMAVLVNLCINLQWNFKNFLLNRFFYWLTILLSDYLMPSDKHNSITAKAMGSISSLFNVALSREVPFCQPLQLQCLHHGSTKAYLCSPLFSILFSTTV